MDWENIVLIIFGVVAVILTALRIRKTIQDRRRGK